MKPTNIAECVRAAMESYDHPRFRQGVATVAEEIANYLYAGTSPSLARARDGFLRACGVHLYDPGTINSEE